MKTLSIAVAAAAMTTSLVASAAIPTHLLGDQALPDQALRTVVITPSTKYVNVTEGDVVNFVSNGKSFVWHFDGPETIAFDLNRVAPAGVLDHTVTAYVAPNDNDH